MTVGLSNGNEIGSSFLEKSGISDAVVSAYGKDIEGYRKELNETTKSGKKASASLDGFNSYLIKNGKQAVKTTSFIEDLGNGIVNVGKTAVSMVGNAALDMVIGTGLNLAIQGISDWINRDQIAIDKGQEAQSTIKNTFDEFSNGKTTLNTLGQSFNKTEAQITNTGDAITSVADKYTELAKGVNSKTNANMSLSDEDYQTYLDLSSQLATLYPQLQSGLDSQGNAMLNLGTNAKSAASDGSYITAN